MKVLGRETRDVEVEVEPKDAAWSLYWALSRKFAPKPDMRPNLPDGMWEVTEGVYHLQQDRKVAKIADEHLRLLRAAAEVAQFWTHESTRKDWGLEEEP